MRFHGRQRLRRTSEFAAVRQHGSRRECGPFLFTWLDRGDGGADPVRRLGVVVPKRVGRAVDRNLAKRRFRALFIRHAGLLPPDGDLVILVRPSAVKSSFAELEKRFVKACQKAHRSQTPMHDEKSPASPK